MPMPGRRPKPEDQRRNRMPPVMEWTLVPHVPFEDPPSLPKTPAAPPAHQPPEPPRPLGAAGRDLWVKTWQAMPVEPDAAMLLHLCEQMDERVGLRVRVMTNNDWRERASLRQLDAQINSGLRRIAQETEARRPARWPAATRRWWRAVSHMPHCALWDESDWSFAIDTASIVASFHNGQLGLAAEIRRREAIMGTTRDARRALRIRYVDPTTEEESDDGEKASVTAMDTYRAMVTPT